MIGSRSWLGLLVALSGLAACTKLEAKTSDAGTTMQPASAAGVSGQQTDAAEPGTGGKSGASGAGASGAGASGAGAAGSGGTAGSSGSTSAPPQGGSAGPACGNGQVDPGETCDPISGCPSAATCRATDACLVPTLSGEPSTCNASCELVPITACQSGDNCCPAGCDYASDEDCSKSCGDGVVSAPETCEPTSQTQPCPSSCDDGKACTTDIQTGSAAACNVTCTHAAITAPHNGDGCCPDSANATNDNDCAVVCGNGVIEAGESCDGDCVTDCADSDACTSDRMVGSADTCDADCVHTDTSSKCVAVPSGWTLGTTVAEGNGCPSGYDGPGQVLRSDPTTSCSKTCSCGAASSGGSCDGTFTDLLADGTSKSAKASSSGLSCAYVMANQGVTSITASALSYTGCSGSSCANCNPMGTSTATLNWAASTRFCALSSSAITCASGKRCPPGNETRCLLASGAQTCPAGFTAVRSWFTGASTASCTCGGCGVASGQSCANAKWAFGYGVCPYASITNSGTSIDQFYTFSASGGSGRYPTTVAVATELIASIMGSPTPGVCGSAAAQQMGTTAGTGQQTLCCAP